MLSEKNQQLIYAALERLLARSNQDAFLIIEEPKSQKFVQFAGSSEEPLIFDLPAQGLSEEELERAKALFADYDIEMEATPIYEDESMERIVDQQYGFSAILDQELELAVELASLVLLEVYGLEADAKLTLEEN